MSYLEELLPEFRKGAKIRRKGVLEPKNGKGYIYYKDKKIYNGFGREVEPDLGLWISKDDWEVYQEPIDWDYIIKNKCHCWFWDKVDDKFNNIGFLAAYNGQAFLSSDSFAYSHCRPVRRDEVTFYEDREE